MLDAEKKKYSTCAYAVAHYDKRQYIVCTPFLSLPLSFFFFSSLRRFNENKYGVTRVDINLNFIVYTIGFRRKVLTEYVMCV